MYFKNVYNAYDKSEIEYFVFLFLQINWSLFENLTIGRTLV